jgi:5-methylthioadenosine/S-adenosylhomocysteine deaminase
VIAPHSIYTCSGELLQWAAELAAERNLVFHIHMNETEQEVSDSLEAHGMRPFVWLDELGVVDHVESRAVAAHGIWLDDAERRIAARHGMTIAHNPASNMKLASGVLDWQALRQAKIPLMLAPDGVASNNNLDMFDEMKLAALLQKVHTGDPTRLSAGEAVALAAGEYSGAFQSFGVTGHLAEGARADLSLINLDHPQMVPLHHIESNLTYAANGSVVDTVVIAGDVVMEGRVVPGEAEVLQEARRCAADLVQSAEKGSK